MIYAHKKVQLAQGDNLVIIVSNMVASFAPAYIAGIKMTTTRISSLTRSIHKKIQAMSCLLDPPETSRTRRGTR